MKNNWVRLIAGALASVVLVGAIARGEEILIPGGMTRLQEGDHVVVVTKSIGAKNLRDILE